MLYWQAVRNEFYNRYAKDYSFFYTTLRYYPEESTTPRPEKAKRKTYIFSEDDRLYLTQREADCIYFLSQGQTIKQTAEELLLSPRTVEFYLKRIKEKFNQPNKKSLLLFLHNSTYFKDFYQTLDNEFNGS